MADPQQQSQAPDTLPADFFDHPANQGTNQSAPSQATAGAPSPQTAPDTLPADFFDQKPAAPPTPSAASPLAPPAISKPTVPMSNSALGTIYGGLAHGPDGAVVNPKLAGAKNLAQSVVAQANDPNNHLVQVGAGSLDAALQTVHSVARVANAVTGDRISGLPTSFQEPEQITPHGYYEGAGSLGEQLAEFATGEGVAKKGALELAEHYGQIAKLAKVIEETPLLQKALSIARTTALSATQNQAHGQDAKEGALYGLGGGVLGEAVLNPLANSISNGLKESRALIAGQNFVKEQALQEARGLGMQSVVKKQLTGATQDAYDALSSKFGDTVGDSMGRQLDQHILSYGDLAEDLKAKAKPVFSQLDQESEGAFQANQNKIQAAKQIIRNPSSIDARESALKSLADAEAAQQKVFSSSKVDPADLKNARSMWRVSSTLEDLHGKLDQAWTVPQAGQGAVSDTSLRLDPKKFNTQLNAAVRSIPPDRLEEAIGKEGIKNLYAINQQMAETVASHARVAAFDRVVNAAAEKAPEGSPLKYMIASPVVGAGVGAVAGAANAKNNGEDVLSGTLQGATKGGLVGVAGALPIGAIRMMYAHPNFGVGLMRLAEENAARASQVARTATHSFNPDTNKVEPIAGKN